MTREEIDALEALARGAISVPEAEVIVRDVPRLCALARECLAWREADGTWRPKQARAEARALRQRNEAGGGA